MSNSTIGDLLTIMATLRDPVRGCPWDREQTFATIAPYTIEEAYEVAEAIAHDDMAGLQDELGDLLLQVVFHAQIAAEAGAFSFADVVTGICAKMIRRHPHVFGKEIIRTADEQTEAWEKMKAEEQAARANRQDQTERPSALANVPFGLPAMTRAVKLQKRAARVGFDWGDLRPVLAKMREELAELEHELDQPAADPAKVAEEFGDLLFVTANLARHLSLDPESALRAANAKFERRFKEIEARLETMGKRAEDCTLAELDAEWEAVKAAERRAASD